MAAIINRRMTAEHEGDFRLEGIPIPVHLWQGGIDTNVPPVMGRYQAQAIPDCIVTSYEDEGHLLGITRLGEILAAITG